MIIIVTGSVGTGKTAFAKALAKKIKHKYIDVNKLIKDKKLRGKYLKDLDSYEVDIKKVNNVLIKLVKKHKNLVIDSHLSHYLVNKYVNYCVVCKCDIKVLKKRLEERKYNKTKIRENLDTEIFDVCLVEALENKHRIIIVDTTKDSIKDCIKNVLIKI